ADRVVALVRVRHSLGDGGVRSGAGRADQADSDAVAGAAAGPVDRPPAERGRLGVQNEEIFDPRSLLAALDRNYVSYVLSGGLARVLRGTDEVTNGVDLCPGLRFENVDRLVRALEELEARRADRRRLVVDEETLSQERVLDLRTSRGELKVVAEPAGTRRGY